MASMAFRLYKIQFQLELRPGPHCGNLRRSPICHSLLGRVYPSPLLTSRRLRRVALDIFGVEAQCLRHRKTDTGGSDPKPNFWICPRYPISTIYSLHTLIAVPWSTQPSTLCGMVKWVSAFGMSNNNKCGRQMRTVADFTGGLAAQFGWLGLRIGGLLALSLHSPNEQDELWQWLCHYDSNHHWYYCYYCRRPVHSQWKWCRNLLMDEEWLRSSYWLSVVGIIALSFFQCSNGKDNRSAPINTKTVLSSPSESRPNLELIQKKVPLNNNQLAVPDRDPVPCRRSWWIPLWTRSRGNCVWRWQSADTSTCCCWNLDTCRKDRLFNSSSSHM